MARKKKKKSKEIIINKVKNPQYIIYTDGGCETNPGGRGGYGVVILDETTGEMRTYSAGFKSSTNNRMELMAGIVAMNAIPVGSTAILYSDSQYFIYCFNGMWRRNKNNDLFEKADRAAAGKQIEFRWVGGHSGVEYNEICDTLATNAMNRKKLMEDTGYVSEIEARRVARRKAREEEEQKGSMGMSIDVPEEFSTTVLKEDSTKYAEEHQINTVCAAAILEFAEKGEGKKFRDYVLLKTGGLDFWSRKKLPELISMSQDGEKALNVLQGYFANEKDVLTAMRWYCRGLPLRDCIRKIYVDREVSEKANLKKETGDFGK